jgi:succinoglycan biosynthesis transport protein ExoP
MKLNKYIFPLRKWWWLLVGSTLIAAIFSSVSVLRQPTIYQARTTLMIGTTINNPNPSTNELSLGQQLASAYANLANRELVYDATKNALGMTRLPEYIASALPNTQLIEIVVNDSDPQRAQTVANHLAAQLMLLRPMSAQSEERDRQEFVHERLNSLEEQIRETEAEIEKLQGDLVDAFSAQQISDLQAQINSLQSKLGAMENNYGLLLSNSQQGAINTLTVIAAADLPTSPIGPMKGLTILLAAAAGLLLAACEAYLLEYLDDTLKYPDDVERLFSAPIIGHIFEQGDGKNGAVPLNNADDLGQPIGESFRGLRTNIEISQASRPLKTILVTSADIADGKTSVAANLALSLAQREKDVVLLDVDLRRPSIHEFFELSNDRGLVDLISDTATISDVLEFKKDKRLAILASGGTPVNPTELLSSKKMDQILSTLEEAADVVIIDGPPLIVADSLVMASKVDGVLLVVRPGHTRLSLAQAAAEQIKMSGARMIGVVLNRIPHDRADVFAGKSHVYSYYMGNYRDERERKDKELNLEKVPEMVMETLSPYTTKASNSIKHFFRTVFKVRPKERLP